MSTAHRPTWAPAQARDAGHSSRQVSAKDVNGQTKLKFRQPGQGTASEVARRDLRLELERAEEAARRKRKGLPPAEEEAEQDKAAGVPAAGLVAGAPAGGTKAVEDEQAAKRRKLIEEAAELDRDDTDEEDEDTPAKPATNGDSKGKGKAVDVPNDDDDEEEGEEEDDDTDDEEDDEDETAELLRELEKIKRERAEEKARQERDRAESAALSAEEAAATGNPLLDLKAALAGSRTYDSPGGYSSSTASSFQIKKRWDDDVIFKNQAMKSDEPKKEFVNDLIRTEFHKRFLKKFIA